MTKITGLVARVIAFARDQPVAVHAAGAEAVVILARFGVHLDANTTVLVSAIALTIATAASHRKVTPMRRVRAMKIPRRRR